MEFLVVQPMRQRSDQDRRGGRTGEGESISDCVPSPLARTTACFSLRLANDELDMLELRCNILRSVGRSRGGSAVPQTVTLRAEAFASDGGGRIVETGEDKGRSVWGEGGDVRR